MCTWGTVESQARRHRKAGDRVRPGAGSYSSGAGAVRQFLTPAAVAPPADTSTSTAEAPQRSSDADRNCTAITETRLYPGPGPTASCPRLGRISATNRITTGLQNPVLSLTVLTVNIMTLGKFVFGEAGWIL